MIKEIHIKNIALIDEAIIQFKQGFNVLSGETGAGKSIVVDAVNLILGGRADKELIKTGTDKAFVQAELYVDDIIIPKIEEQFGIDIEDSQIILSRELTISGKNTCRINYRVVTLAVLKEVCGMLVNLHGQNQTYSESQNHLQILDNFGGYSQEIHAVRNAYKHYQELKGELDGLTADQSHKQRTIDMLEHQIQEIEDANLKLGEEEELEENKNVMLHAEKIASSLRAAYADVQSALEQLYSAQKEMEDISDISQDYQKIYEVLSDVYYTAEDISYEISANEPEMEFTVQDIDEVELRLSVLQSLKRKYGETIEKVIEYKDECVQKLDMLIDSDTHIGKIKEKLKLSEQELSQKCEALSKARKNAAKNLDASMVEHLKELGMGDAQFESRFTKAPITHKGAEDIEFYITVNKGEPLKPMSKVASGGETSRIMLALKTITASKDNIGTLIFDEIDTGISGNMANVVARKMYKITSAAQVICVTHLAQIAAMADVHFLISKSSDEVRTYTKIDELENEEIVCEIARLTGGNNSEIAQKHAKEILAVAKKFKKS